MSSSSSVLIVGGGVVGLCAAYYAAQKGSRVTVLERGGPEYDCCSIGNAGLISPSHFIPLASPEMVKLGLKMMLNPESPFWVRPRLSKDLWKWAWRFYRAATPQRVAQAAPTLCKYLLASRNLFEEMAQAADNEFQLERGGLMVICRTSQRLEEERRVAAQGRALGLGVEDLPPEQACALQGGLRMDIAGALLYTDDWWLTPQLHLAWLRRELSRCGAQFQWNAEVTGWETAGERIKSVRTTQGDFSADEYVVACGSWTPRVVKPLGLRLLIQPGKGYSLTLPTPRRKVPVSSVLAEGRVAVTQMGETLRFAGTMEMSGLDNFVNPRRIVGIMKSVSRFFPEFTADDFWDIPAWNGLRPVTPDGLAYIGRFRRYRNLAVGAGHAMLGLSLGPITGRLLAETICGEPPSLPLETFSPDRYM